MPGEPHDAHPAAGRPRRGVKTQLTPAMRVWPRDQARRLPRQPMHVHHEECLVIYVELTAPSPPAGAGRASWCSSCSGLTSQGREDATHARNAGLAERDHRRHDDSTDSRCTFIMKNVDIYVQLTAPSPPAGAGRASRCSSCSGLTSQGHEDATLARNTGLWSRDQARRLHGQLMHVHHEGC